MSLFVILPLRLAGDRSGHAGGYRPVPGKRYDPADIPVPVYVVTGTMPGEVPPLLLQPPLDLAGPCLHGAYICTCRCKIKGSGRLRQLRGRTVVRPPGRIGQRPLRHHHEPLAPDPRGARSPGCPPPVGPVSAARPRRPLPVGPAFRCAARGLCRGLGSEAVPGPDQREGHIPVSVRVRVRPRALPHHGQLRSGAA